MRRLLLAVAVAASPAAASAQPAVAPQAVAPAPSQAAVALAELVTPLDLSVEAELAGARAGFMSMIDADADVKAIEAQYPGIVEFALKEVEPLLREHAIKQRPLDVAELARLYDGLLKPAEIAVLDAYYRTATGQRTIRTMFTGADLAPVLAEVASDPEGTVSAKALASSNDAAKRKLLADTGPGDNAAVDALLRGISMAKLDAVGAAVQALSLKQVNAADPAFDAVLEEATGKAFETFMTRQEKKR